MKRIVTFVIAVLLMPIDMDAQESAKKILLASGNNENIQYENLNINVLLQEYDEASKAHLIGTVYLRINNSKNETIADFHFDNNQQEGLCCTKIYKNYFLSLKIENNNKYLIMEHAQFGKVFALSNNGKARLGFKNDSVEIEIIDFYYEDGYTAPPEDNSREYFADVHYTLKVKAQDTVSNFSFYSSQLKDGYTISTENYNIQILSDTYKNSKVLIEMLVDKKN